MSYYADKVVVVTGAGSGIGRASALAYAAARARVHLVDLSDERLGAVSEEIRARGGRATAHALDCTDPDAVEKLAEEIVATEGRVDVLQNGVGLLVSGACHELGDEQWRRALEVNLMSVVYALRAFVPHLLRQGGPAHVVNIASLAGLVPFPYTAVYSASKAAVVGLSEAASMELWRRKIFVTLVCPGAVRTRILQDGLLCLPGDSSPGIREAFDRFAAPPERVAARILRAVRRRRSLVLATPSMGPLWWLKRVFPRIFSWLSRRITSSLLRRAEGAP
jgi:NAD(P)-dependent dehydrogenase (short-subunit alcohol dehydrogenase family)